MPNSAYQRGNNAERRACATLQRHGWYTWQTRGSKSAADIVAMRGGVVLLVQVKYGETEITGAEWNALYQLSTMIGAIPIYASTRPREGFLWVRMCGEHPRQSRVWPGIEFDPAARNLSHIP